MSGAPSPIKWSGTWVATSCTTVDVITPTVDITEHAWASVTGGDPYSVSYESISTNILNYETNCLTGLISPYTITITETESTSAAAETVTVTDLDSLVASSGILTGTLPASDAASVATTSATNTSTAALEVGSSQASPTTTAPSCPKQSPGPIAGLLVAAFAGGVILTLFAGLFESCLMSRRKEKKLREEERKQWFITNSRRAQEECHNPHGHEGGDRDNTPIQDEGSRP